MEQGLATTTAYKAAETYEQFFVPGIFRYWTPQLLRRAAPQIGERVLDVACGTGVVARSIVPVVGKQGRVVGLDINPAMLEVACRQYSDYCDDIEWHEGQAENIPFPDNTFDLVTCQQGLQFFKDRSKAAVEFRRVLNPNGRAVIEVWQSMERHPFYQEMFNTIGTEFNIPVSDVSSPYSFGDPEELFNLLERAGFREVRVENVHQDARFSEVDWFVELTIRAAAAVVPAFALLDGDEQAKRLGKVTQRISGLINDNTINGNLIIPMYANIATAIF